MRRPGIWVFAGIPLVVLGFGAVGYETVLISLFGVLAVIALGPVYILWLNRKHSRRLAILAACLLVGSAAANAAMEITSFPLRIGYHLSKGQMDDLADKLLSGDDVSAPRWVGVLRVKKAEVSANGIACLWTQPHPAGNTGFVMTSPDYVPFNLWSHTRIDDRWQFISED